MLSTDKRFIRNSLLLIFGLIGVVTFFYLYPGHHPLNTVQFDLSREEIVEKADSVFESWQFQSEGFHSRARAYSSNQVLDSLQKQWGVNSFQSQLQKPDNTLKKLLFRWNIEKQSDLLQEYDSKAEIGINLEGDVVDFEITPDFIRQQRPFNRLAIRKLFDSQVQDYTRELEDSLVAGLVDYQHLNNNSISNSKALQIREKLKNLRGSQSDEVYTSNIIWKGAEFYLQKMVWKDFNLQKDSTQMMDEGEFRFARAYLSYIDSASGMKINLTLDLLPAGSLKEVRVDVQPEIQNREVKGEEIETLRMLIIIGFTIWVLFIFYLRIKARAIDIKPAMIIAVLAGFIGPAYTALFFIQETGFFFADISTTDIINSLIVMAILGAISTVTFFVLTAVSDSVTRQYWPEKLKTWDLIRRGDFKNKPVGWVILHGVSIGGILAGVWALLFYIFPSQLISTNLNLVSDTYFLAPLADLLASVFIVLLLVVTLYLILSNYLIGLSAKTWIIPIVSGLIFALVDVIPADITPWTLKAASSFLIGTVLGLIYVKFDFMAVALGFFVFVNLLLSEEGWLIENSPDGSVFYFFVIIVGILLAFAVYFVVKGVEREKLPEYVPAYIEEQAKEQRLKQELEIARVVQQTFLPSKIHRLPNIDIVGTCIPAQETGGDYYDMISLGESRTAITIGDVSGKGIRAAFYMTFAKGVLHSLSAIILSPVELLNQLNRLFNENATRGTFISMIYGILEADKRQFTFARAGHNPILVMRKNGDAEWLQPKGIGIGVAKDDAFIKCTEESVLKLREGDIAILYTDGLTEMLNSANQFFGEKRLEKLVRGIREASSSEMLEIIIDEVNAFKGAAKQHDDMTIVIIKADASVNP